MDIVMVVGSHSASARFVPPWFKMRSPGSSWAEAGGTDKADGKVQADGNVQSDEADGADETDGTTETDGAEKKSTKPTKPRYAPHRATATTSGSEKEKSSHTL